MQPQGTQPTTGAALVYILSRRGGGRRGSGAADELVAWAGRALSAGIDADAVCVLAGEPAPRDAADVDPLLDAVLDALSLPEPASQDELYDAELRLTAAAIVAGELPASRGLTIVSEVVVRSGFSPRFLDWGDLAEDALLLASGEVPAFALEPARESLEGHIQRLAQATLVECPEPSWLGVYLDL